MFALAVDIDKFPALGQVVQSVAFQVQLTPQLIEVRHLQIGTQPDATLGRLKLTQQQSHQRGLAGSVLPYQADLVAPQNGQRHIPDNRLTARVGKACLPGFGHQLAGTGRLFD